jgi:hypothetical protein
MRAMRVQGQLFEGTMRPLRIAIRDFSGRSFPHPESRTNLEAIAAIQQKKPAFPANGRKRATRWRKGPTEIDNMHW